MRKALCVMCATILIAAGAAGAVRGSKRSFAKRLVNRESLARSAAGATWGEIARRGGGGAWGVIRHPAHGWGPGPSGLGKSFASSMGRHVVKTSIQTGVGALHHEDLSYHRSNLQGTWPRLKYAVGSTFWVPRTNRPGHTVALGRLSGNMGAGLISRAWQPASTAGIGAGVASGGVGIAGDVGIHVAREFWPQHRRR
jgi:hypothetical protein